MTASPASALALFRASIAAALSRTSCVPGGTAKVAALARGTPDFPKSACEDHNDNTYHTTTPTIR